MIKISHDMYSNISEFTEQNMTDISYDQNHADKWVNEFDCLFEYQTPFQLSIN